MVNEEESPDIKKDLEMSVGDYAHAGVRAGLSTAPFLGGPLAEFFSMVITPPLERRRDAWMVEIFSRLKMLEGKVDGFTIESLAGNEVFISTLFYATQVAMRTHQQEKLDALKNAVTNSITTVTVDENQQLIFLNLIDRFTPWHLKLLQFSNDPRKYGESRGVKYPGWTFGGNLGAVIEITFPDLKNREAFYNQIVKELISNGLMTEGTYLQGMMTEQGMFASRITEMGKQFLNFIS